MKHRQGIRSKSEQTTKSPLRITTTRDVMEVKDAKEVGMGMIHLLEEGDHVLVYGGGPEKEFVRRGDDLEFIGRREKGGKVEDNLCIGDIYHLPHESSYYTIIHKKEGDMGYYSFTSDKQGNPHYVQNGFNIIHSNSWLGKEPIKVGHIDLEQSTRNIGGECYTYYKSGNENIDIELANVDNRWKAFSKNATKEQRKKYDEQEDMNYHFENAKMVTDWFDGHFEKGGKTKNKNEITYNGNLITKLLPSGYYEFYSDDRGRFLKFDDLDAAKAAIDRETNASKKISKEAVSNIVNTYNNIKPGASLDYHELADRNDTTLGMVNEVARKIREGKDASTIYKEIKAEDSLHKTKQKEYAEGGYMEAGGNTEDELSNVFYIVVDKDERGEYGATIYNSKDQQVWEIETDEVKEMQEDGILKFKPHEDLDRLSKYLSSIGKIPPHTSILTEDYYNDLRSGSMASGGTIRKAKVKIQEEPYFKYVTVERELPQTIITNQGIFPKEDVIREFYVDSRIIKERGGKVGFEVKELAGMLGTRVENIQPYVDRHNLSNQDVLKIVTGLGRKQLNSGDVATAMFLGRPDNELSRQLLEYVKSDKAYAMEKGGEIHTEVGEGEDLVFKADTKGGKYSIEVVSKENIHGKYYDINEYKNGRTSGGGSRNTKEDMVKWLKDTLQGSRDIDGINYVISVDKLGIGSYSKGGQVGDHKIGDLVFARNEGMHGLVGLVVSDRKEDDGDQVQDVYFRGLRGAILPVPIGQAEDIIEGGHLYDAENNGDISAYSSISKKIGVKLNPVYQEAIDNHEEFSKEGKIELYSWKKKDSSYTSPAEMEEAERNKISVDSIEEAIKKSIEQSAKTGNRVEAYMDDEFIGSSDNGGKFNYGVKWRNKMGLKDDKKELGGILIAGLIGAAIGGAAGYGYRDSITTAKEKAQQRALDKKKEAIEALERRKAKIRQYKENVKSKAISQIQRLEKGGSMETNGRYGAYHGVSNKDFDDWYRYGTSSQKDFFWLINDTFKEGNIRYARKLFAKLSYKQKKEFTEIKAFEDAAKVLSERMENGGSMEKGGKLYIRGDVTDAIGYIERNRGDNFKPESKEEQIKLTWELIGYLALDDDEFDSIYNWLSGYLGTPFVKEKGRYLELKKDGGSMEKGGKMSDDKKKLLNDIKTLQDAIDNSLLDDETKAKIPAKIDAKRKKIAEIEEEERKVAEKIAEEKAQADALERERKLRTQSSKNKTIYIDIDRSLKEKMRNAIHAEGIPYESKTEGDTFRVFLSNQNQLDIVTRLYNEKREKLGMEPISKEQVASVVKQRVGKLKFMPVKAKPNVKAKLPVEKKRSVKKVDKKRASVKGKAEEESEG